MASTLASTTGLAQNSLAQTHDLTRPRQGCLTAGLPEDKLPMHSTTLEHPGGARRRPVPPPGPQPHLVRYFGHAPRLLAVEPHRYLMAGDLAQAPARRLSILMRLLGLDEPVPYLALKPAGPDDWSIEDPRRLLPGPLPKRLLSEHYGGQPAVRPHSPALLDARTGGVLCDEPDVLMTEFETSWRPLHDEDAPDLYPAALRIDVDTAIRRIRELTRISTRVCASVPRNASRRLATTLESQLDALDRLLARRRFLFGEHLTTADIWLFVYLCDYERLHRPALTSVLGERRIRHLDEFGQLWAYARDLFALGFMDQREAYHVALVPDSAGMYVEGGFRGRPGQRHDTLAAWREPAGRAALTAASPWTAGSPRGTARDSVREGPQPVGTGTTRAGRDG
ncbi:glutathione S-transferase C-terminal domain-containing protein [Propionibacterium cyclohexanicum]|nr:glutathione S-transferase C-terminal domain-containing protein [Propionibacterium cyclohexanicum]